MSSHTPTPWMWVEGGEFSYASITGNDGTRVCHFGDNKNKDPEDSAEPEADDVDLIIRAVNSHSDLLTACELADGAFAALAEVNNLPSNWRKSVVEPLRAAISKAKGGAA